MISTELQNEVETLAQSLGQTPDSLLAEILAEKKKAWALSKLDKAANSTESTRQVDLNHWAETRQAEMLERHNLA